MKSLLEALIGKSNANDADSGMPYFSNQYMFLLIPDYDALEDAENYFEDDDRPNADYWVMDFEQLKKYVNRREFDSLVESHIYMYPLKKTEYNKIRNKLDDLIFDDWDYQEEFRGWKNIPKSVLMKLKK